MFYMNWVSWYTCELESVNFRTICSIYEVTGTLDLFSIICTPQQNPGDVPSVSLSINFIQKQGPAMIQVPLIVGGSKLTQMYIWPSPTWLRAATGSPCSLILSKYIFILLHLPSLRQFHLKMDGWIFQSFPFGVSPYLQGQKKLLVSEMHFGEIRNKTNLGFAWPFFGICLGKMLGAPWDNFFHFPFQSWWVELVLSCRPSP